MREAKVLAGIDPDADVVLQVFPQPKPIAEQVAELLSGGVGAAIDQHTRSFLESGLPAPLQALRVSNWAMSFSRR